MLLADLDRGDLRGGFVVRSMTKSLLSGTSFQFSPSFCQSTELATMASFWSGVMARLVGGPMTVFRKLSSRMRQSASEICESPS